MKPILYRETKWLRFFVIERKKKTVVIEVQNTSEQILGTIKWYTSWRQYCFMPTAYVELIFNNRCLGDITDLLTYLNTEHKAGRPLNI